MKSPAREMLSRLLLVLLLAAPDVVASDCSGEQCVAVGQFELGVALGAGMRSNPLEDGDEVPLVLIPSIAYWGERFFINNLDVGYTLADGEHSQWNLLATPGFDNLYFERHDPRNIFFDAGTGSGLDSAIGGISAPTVSEGGTGEPEPLPEARSASDEHVEPVSLLETPDLDSRDFALMAGLEYSGWHGDDNWQLQALRDVTGVHEGYELRAAWQRAFATGEDAWLGTVGVAWKSSRLVDYYYGVDAHEAGPGREYYRADGAVTVFARIGWRRPLGERWQLRADLQYDYLGSEISDSPLVKQGYSVAGFFGVHYRIW